MMTMLDDLRLALRQICGAMGLSGTAATVVPLVVLGVALNVAALSAMEYMRNERHSWPWTDCVAECGAHRVEGGADGTDVDAEEDQRW